jgi:hypothetical protein
MIRPYGIVSPHRRVSIVDAVVMEGPMDKVLSCHDKESDYSCRIGELAAFRGQTGIVAHTRPIATVGYSFDYTPR